jgi:hypothetical protein
MYVDVSHIRQGDKTYTRYLLRESFRDNGKVKHRTIANLSSCSAAEIEAIRLALRHKDNLSALTTTPPQFTIKQGPSYGAVHVVYGVARSLGIDQALGPTRDGQLALWQVIARVIDQGSRLSAVRLARSHATQEILGLQGFDEDDLYANLDWLAEQQADIEKRLFDQQQAPQGLFLYDVTSSYLEGEKNALGAFGYNRDNKRGKRQIVVGLLCNGLGRPLAIEVFPGNTQDTKTFASQVDKVATRFGGGVHGEFANRRINGTTGAIKQLHSDSYRNPDKLLPAVLVVGSAQSGAQIAEDLYESGRKVFLAVGRAGRTRGVTAARTPIGGSTGSATMIAR